ncbi:MAG: type II toxin-antitoxin system RelE/ParE family toxin [Coriobacteriales bacterium]|nr:type II toxin-antitoxin system RelE/ParE family toxin [Coriobacteriales bacterium]
MITTIYSDRFMNDMANIYADKVYKAVIDAIRAIETMPGVGSLLIRMSLQEEFGKNIRKVVVNPFDLIYEYDQEKAIVYLHALIYQRSIK